MDDLLNEADTKGSMFAAPMQMLVMRRGDTNRVVLRDCSGLKLQKIKFHGKPEGSHKNTRTSSQHHELQRNHA